MSNLRYLNWQEFSSLKPGDGVMIQLGASLKHGKIYHGTVVRGPEENVYDSKKWFKIDGLVGHEMDDYAIGFQMYSREKAKYAMSFHYSHWLFPVTVDND